MSILNHNRKLSVSEIAILKRVAYKGINEHAISLRDFRILPSSDFLFEIDVQNLVDDNLIIKFEGGLYNITDFGKELVETL